MSKYGKKLKEKEWRKQNRLLNRQQVQNLKAVAGKSDPRSTTDTFLQWCEECGDNLIEAYGVLSIAGSDGIKMSDTKVGKASYDNPEAVDLELEAEGYYEEADVNLGSYHYMPPTRKYGDWFYNVYLKRI